MIFSIIFLLITLAIYAYVKELRNLRGKLLMNYMVSLIIFYIFGIIARKDFLPHPSVVCTINGFLSYASALMAIFMLNVIAIDYFTSF